MTSVSGRGALVTGGGSGIGRALALALAAEGCAVAVVDVAEARAAAVMGEIAGKGGKAAAFACDVSDRACVAALQAQVASKFGAPSLVFANAGVTSFHPFAEMTAQEIDWVIQVNLMGAVHCVEAFLPEMLARRDGHIMATASTAGLIPSRSPHQAPYAASKMGIIGLMLNLRADYAKDGVGFTALIPGAVHGRMLDSPTVRPQRFGGPGEPIRLQGHKVGKIPYVFREPEQVAQMALRGVRNDRAMVLTDETRRGLFQTLYADAVLQAFDELDAFLAEADAATAPGQSPRESET